MERRILLVFMVIGAVLLAIGLAPAAVAAGDLAPEGKYDVRSGCSGESHVLASIKDHMGGSYTAICTPDAAPGAMFHRTIFQCFGSWSLSAGNYDEHGICEATDPAGDKLFGLYAKKNQEDGTWRVTGGTGKYQGMEMSGLWNTAAEMPPLPGRIANVSHWWGRYKLQQ
jgi:hypothetical protein